MSIVLDFVDLAVCQVDHALCVFRGNGIVGHHHNGDTFLMQTPQEIQNVAPGTAVEVACGFICDDHDWIIDQCPRDRHALLLTPGEFLRLVINTIRKTYQLEHLERLLLAFFITDVMITVIE